MTKTIEAFDYVIIVLVLSVSIFIGVYHGFRKKINSILKITFSVCKRHNSKIEDIELKSDVSQINDGSKLPSEAQTSDYLTANSSMGSIPVAFSLLASFFSAVTILGTSAEIYTYGIQHWLCVFGIMITPLVGAFATGPFFARCKVFSVFEYLELRYNSKRVRQVGTGIYIIKCFISSAIFMYGPATVLSRLTALNELASIALIGIIGTFYTAIGGIRAVIWTDLFQGSIMFISVLIVNIKGIVDVGGFSNLFRINYDGGRLNFFDFNPDPFIRQSFWSNIFGMFVHFSLSYAFDQQMLQRFQATKTKKLAQRALVINVPGTFLIISLCCFAGLVIYANNYDCDPLTNPYDRLSNPNQLMGLFVMNNLSMYPGVAGFFLASLFCGSLSSVSSSLGSQAGLIWKDILKEFKYFQNMSDSKELLINKTIVLICGIISCIIAFVVGTLGGNLATITVSLNGAFNSPIIGLFVLSMFFPFTNWIGAIVAPLVGFGMSLWLSLGAFITKPYYPKLDVSIEGCTNITSLSYQYSSQIETVVGLDKFYSLSYLWYATFGTLVTIFTGLFVSFLTYRIKNEVSKRYILFNIFYIWPKNSKI